MDLENERISKNLEAHCSGTRRLILNYCSSSPPHDLKRGRKKIISITAAIKWHLIRWLRTSHYVMIHKVSVQKLTQFSCSTGCWVKKQFNVAMFCGGETQPEWVYSCSTFKEMIFWCENAQSVCYPQDQQIAASLSDGFYCVEYNGTFESHITNSCVPEEMEDLRMWFLSLDMAATASSWERNSTSASPVDLPLGAKSMWTRSGFKGEKNYKENESDWFWQLKRLLQTSDRGVTHFSDVALCSAER